MGTYGNSWELVVSLASLAKKISFLHSNIPFLSPIFVFGINVPVVVFFNQRINQNWSFPSIPEFYITLFLDKVQKNVPNLKIYVFKSLRFRGLWTADRPVKLL